MDCAKRKILEHGVIAICRKIYGDELLRLSDALYAGGLRQLEVTYDQSDPQCIEKTAEAISMLISHNPDMDFGAGTVLTEEQVRATKQAGGKFVISPNTDVKVITLSKELGMLSIPGAMTPSEIMCAYNAGADIVKLFPAASLGTGYIKDIRAPINHIPLMATGGVSVDNFADFLKAGCCSAGVGSFLSDRKLIAAGDWDGLQARAKQFCDIFAAHGK